MTSPVMTSPVIMSIECDITKFVIKFLQAFSSNFGGNSLSKGIKGSNQMTVFFYFFNGIVIWIAYRASITAGLSARELKLPFHNLSIFTQCKRMYVHSMGHAKTKSCI